MNRHKLFFLLVSLCLLAARSGQATTWYVATPGFGLQNGTSPANAWPTIQTAVGKIPGTVLPGDTVDIEPGTYAENVFFNFNSASPGPAITFTGVGALGTVKVGYPASYSGTPIIRLVDSNYITITNLDISGEAVAGAVQIESSSNVSITNNYIHHISATGTFNGFGVHVFPDSGVVTAIDISGNTFFDLNNSQGDPPSKIICLEGDVTNSQITNNTITSQDPLTGLTDACEAYLNGIDINPDPTSPTGIFIQSNHINNLDAWGGNLPPSAAGGTGIFLDGATYCTVTANSVANTQGWGIQVGFTGSGGGGNYNLISNNIVYGSSISGLNIGSDGDSSGNASYNSVLNNTLYDNSTVSGLGEITLGGGSTSIPCTQNIFENNIVYAASAANTFLTEGTGSSAPTNTTFDYNDWYSATPATTAFNASNGTAYDGLANWHTSSPGAPDAHSNNSDPLFVGPVSPVTSALPAAFYLECASPEIDAGTNEAVVLGDYSHPTTTWRPINVKWDIGAYEVSVCGSSPTDTPSSTSTPTATDSPTASPTKTSTASPSDTRTPSATASVTLTSSMTASPSDSPSKTSTPTPTGTPTQSLTATESDSPTASPTKTDSASPTYSPTQSVTFSPTNSFSASPTATPTRSVTDSPTQSVTFSPTGSFTDSPTDTPTFSATDSPTQSVTFSPTGSFTDTPTDTSTFSATDSPTQSDTFSPTNSLTATPTDTPTFSATDSPTQSVTFSPTNSFTATPTDTPTFSATDSPTQSVTFSPTNSFTATGTWTRTATVTLTFTVSDTPAPAPYAITVNIYNSAGELVRSLYNGNSANSAGQAKVVQTVSAGGGPEVDITGLDGSAGTDLIWNATNNGGQTVVSGTYYVQIATTNNFGQVQTQSTTVSIVSQTGTASLGIFNSAGELVANLSAYLANEPSLPIAMSLVLPTGDTSGVVSSAGSAGPALTIKVTLSDGSTATVPWNGLNAQGQPLQPGNYLVTLAQAEPGAGALIKSQTFVILDTKDKTASAMAQSARAFPNPVTGNTFTVTYLPDGTDSALAVLYNLAGQRVAEGADRGSGSLQVSGSWSAGAYLLDFEVHNGQALLSRHWMKVAIVR